MRKLHTRKLPILASEERVIVYTLYIVIYLCIHKGDPINMPGIEIKAAQ